MGALGGHIRHARHRADPGARERGAMGGFRPVCGFRDAMSNEPSWSRFQKEVKEIKHRTTPSGVVCIRRKGGLLASGCCVREGPQTDEVRSDL